MKKQRHMRTMIYTLLVTLRITTSSHSGLRPSATFDQMPDLLRLFSLLSR